MVEDRGKVELSAQAARTGKEAGVVRFVLLISLVLAVIAGILIFLFGMHQ